jgi:hypothetical protein
MFLGGHMNLVSNIPAALEWRVYKGDTASLAIAILDDKNEPVDLTGITFDGELRISPEDSESDRSLAITVLENVLTVEIPDTDTLPRTCYYDIQSNNDGTIQTIIKGMIITETDVTRL